jgi:hypothetical protein
VANRCDLSAMANLLHTHKDLLYKRRESSKKYDIIVYDNVGRKTKIEKELL